MAYVENFYLSYVHNIKIFLLKCLISFMPVLDSFILSSQNSVFSLLTILAGIFLCCVDISCAWEMYVCMLMMFDWFETLYWTDVHFESTMEIYLHRVSRTLQSSSLNLMYVSVLSRGFGLTF
jgi:hypothetical protein